MIKIRFFRSNTGSFFLTLKDIIFFDKSRMSLHSSVGGLQQPTYNLEALMFKALLCFFLGLLQLNPEFLYNGIHFTFIKHDTKYKTYLNSTEEKKHKNLIGHVSDHR